MQENWLPIPGYEGFYEASDMGRIRSVDRIIRTRDGVTSLRKGKIISTKFVANEKRVVVHLWKENNQKLFRLHKLIMLTFVGPRPEGMDICHYDGNAQNNRLDNLRYDTRSANIQDAIRHGTSTRGDNNGRSVLNSEMVMAMRLLRKQGHTVKSISNHFGVKYQTAVSATNGYNWVGLPL